MRLTHLVADVMAGTVEPRTVTLRSGRIESFEPAALPATATTSSVSDPIAQARLERWMLRSGPSVDLRRWVPMDRSKFFRFRLLD